MPPAPVSVLTLEPVPVPIMSELPGRIVPTRLSEVRARVSGILQERVFQQGTHVNEGDVLFRIDPKLYQVRVKSAEAALQRANATQANARQQFQRQRTLRDRNIASGVDLDLAEVAVAQAEADVAFAQAALDEARINLDYTEVRAPITGVIGAALATEGALVTADSGQSLALIQQIDPVYADFTQSSSELLALRRAVEAGILESPTPGQARVELLFDDGSASPEAGRLLFSSANVDASTGQVTLRAEFPNPKGDLLPGLYVRIRIEQAIRQDGIKIPQRAVIRAQDGSAQVYVVEDDTAQLRALTLGQSLDSQWVVEAGLNGGEVIVVEGLQKVQPGGKVATQPWESTKQAQSGSSDPAVVE